MHSSSLAIFVFLAAVSPALSAPVFTPPSCSSLRQGTALRSARSGLISDILCFSPIDPSSVSSTTPTLGNVAAPSGSAVPSPPQYSFSKVPTAAVSAQGSTTEQSGAFSLGDLKNIASVTPNGSGNQQQRRSYSAGQDGASFEGQEGAFFLEDGERPASIGTLIHRTLVSDNSKRESVGDLLARAGVEGLVARSNGQHVNPAVTALLKLAMHHGRALNELN